MMQPVDYHIASIRELEQQWPREPNAWLSRLEQQRCLQLTHPQRRSEWMAARWLGKRMLSEGCEHPLSQIEIRSVNSEQHPCRPQAFVNDVLQPCDVSISHSADWVAVALATSGNGRIGIDLVPEHLPSKHSMNVWLTQGEQVLLNDVGSGVTLSILWGIKEAVYKAVNHGEAFRPALWDVRRLPDQQYQCLAPSDVAVECSIQVVRHEDHIVAVATCSL
ncbi:MAG: 4'-phosphopantetheinyl transferase superfamily protein [Planctomycetaceae bacterium]